MALVLDTGPPLAALDAADPDHGSCSKLLSSAHEDLVVPGLVLAELDYWCHERLSGAAWITFLDDLIEGAYRAEPPSAADLRRCRDLQAEYADLRLGVVDASVIALAERLGEDKVATLDHRHFAVVPSLRRIRRTTRRRLPRRATVKRRPVPVCTTTS